MGLQYIPESGVLIRKSTGKRCGYKRPDGYRGIEYKGVAYFEHRLIWIMFYGDIPDGYCVDHINCVRDDNRLENLRLVTPTQSSWHRSSSGKLPKGLYKNGKGYAVKVVAGGVCHYLGTHDLVTATRIAEDARANLHGEFNHIEES